MSWYDRHLVYYVSHDTGVEYKEQASITHDNRIGSNYTSVGSKALGAYFYSSAGILILRITIDDLVYIVLLLR